MTMTEDQMQDAIDKANDACDEIANNKDFSQEQAVEIWEAIASNANMWAQTIAAEAEA